MRSSFEGVFKLAGPARQHQVVCKAIKEAIDGVARILTAAEGGATKTKIMYKAFLSYAQLKEYSTVMVDSNLLEYDGQRRKFLKLYEKIEDVTHSSSSAKQEISRLPVV